MQCSGQWGYLENAVLEVSNYIKIKKQWSVFWTGSKLIRKKTKKKKNVAWIITKV